MTEPTIHIRPKPARAPEPGASVWRPTRWLGSPATSGLRLPDARPSARTVYAPRGVCPTPDGGLVVCDTGNHRVLVWHTRPDADHAPADVVLGQPDFGSEGPQAAGRGATNGLKLPTGVLVTPTGALLVCDAWNHRLLVWDRVPTASNTPPDRVVGQDDPHRAEGTNRGDGSISGAGFDCPYAADVLDDDALLVADTGNRRILVWDAVPADGIAADAVIGQDDACSGEENRGRGPGPTTFRWPHAFAVCAQPGQRTATAPLLIADAGNHRVVGWRGGLAAARTGADPDLLLGQRGFDSAFEMPHVPQGADRLRFPYALVADDRRILVADTANNRVLGFAVDDVLAAAPGTARAVEVLGQNDFDAAGENRWDAVLPDTLCWPYGLALTPGGDLAVTDSGNNRVMLWSRRASTRPSS